MGPGAGKTPGGPGEVRGKVTGSSERERGQRGCLQGTEHSELALG